MPCTNIWEVHSSWKVEEGVISIDTCMLCKPNILEFCRKTRTGFRAFFNNRNISTLQHKKFNASPGVCYLGHNQKTGNLEFRTYLSLFALALVTREEDQGSVFPVLSRVNSHTSSRGFCSSWVLCCMQMCDQNSAWQNGSSWFQSSA